MIGVFTVVMIVTFAVFFLRWRILVAIRTRHAATWESLGSPSMFSNNSIRNTRRFNRFLKNREYESLKDRALDQTVRTYRAVGMVDNILIAGLLLLIVYLMLFPDSGSVS